MKRKRHGINFSSKKRLGIHHTIGRMKRAHDEERRREQMALLYVHVGQRFKGTWADRRRQEKRKVTAIVAQARVFEAGEYKLEKITMKKPSLYLEIIFPGDPVPRSLWIQPGYFSRGWQVVEASKECGEPEVGSHCANRVPLGYSPTGPGCVWKSTVGRPGARAATWVVSCASRRPQQISGRCLVRFAPCHPANCCV